MSWICPLQSAHTARGSWTFQRTKSSEIPTTIASRVARTISALCVPMCCGFWSCVLSRPPVFELEADEITIGRDVGNRIQLHDTGILRRHAIVRREGGAMTCSSTTKARMAHSSASGGLHRIRSAAAKRSNSAARCCSIRPAATIPAGWSVISTSSRAASRTTARGSCAPCRRPKDAACSKCPSRRP